MVISILSGKVLSWRGPFGKPITVGKVLMLLERPMAFGNKSMWLLGLNTLFSKLTLHFYGEYMFFFIYWLFIRHADNSQPPPTGDTFESHKLVGLRKYCFGIGDSIDFKISEGVLLRQHLTRVDTGYCGYCM